jgi:predicted DNA-binding transcriptional regulator AlpA
MLTSMSRRLGERLLASGRMPPPDVRLGRRLVRWFPATVETWLNSLADRQKGGRS